MIRLGSQLASRFIPRVLNVVEVRALRRPVKFLDSKLGKLFIYGDALYVGHCHVGTEKRKSLYLYVCCTVKTPHHWN